MPNLTPEDISEAIIPTIEQRGFCSESSVTIANQFIENNLEGVDSHGLARFPSFIESVDAGRIAVTQGPIIAARFGAWEQWDGLCGAGPLNARAAMNRAIEIAKDNGLGCVALRRTNHWMRGGAYGKLAAEAGMIGICWTNTMPNMTPWGGDKPTLGNNPLILAVPFEGAPVIMDMAMTQFSYGKLEQHQQSGTQLPVAGGIDTGGNPSADPDEILETGKLLPAGFWKGSGLAFALDLIGSLLASGNATSDIAEMPGEQQISQIFLAFDIQQASERDEVAAHVQRAISWLKSSDPDSVRYPGERAAKTRQERSKSGIPVPSELWDQVRRLKR